MKTANFTDLSPDPSSCTHVISQIETERSKKYVTFFSDGKEQVVHLGLVLGCSLLKGNPNQGGTSLVKERNGYEKGEEEISGPIPRQKGPTFAQNRFHHSRKTKIKYTGHIVEKMRLCMCSLFECFCALLKSRRISFAAIRLGGKDAH